VLELNYLLIRYSYGQTPLIKVGEHQVEIKLCVRPIFKFGPERAQLASHAGHTVAYHVLVVMPQMGTPVLDMEAIPELGAPSLSMRPTGPL
jgi:hypothetical protein